MHLVIGGDGLIGTALCGELYMRALPYAATSRGDDRGGKIKFNLRAPDMRVLPSDADIIYLVAAIAGFGACKTNPDAYRVNVDGPRALIRRFPKAFFVHVSSDVVEMPGVSEYQEHKKAVEAMVDRVNGAVVRPEHVKSSELAADLARVIVDEGLARIPGGLRWPSHERF